MNDTERRERGGDRTSFILAGDASLTILAEGVLVPMVSRMRRRVRRGSVIHDHLHGDRMSGNPDERRSCIDASMGLSAGKQVGT